MKKVWLTADSAIRNPQSAIEWPTVGNLAKKMRVGLTADDADERGSEAKQSRHGTERGILVLVPQGQSPFLMVRHRDAVWARGYLFPRSPVSGSLLSASIRAICGQNSGFPRPLLRRPRAAPNPR